MKRKLFFLSLILFIQEFSYSIVINKFDIITDKRLLLTKEYSKKHYGEDNYDLSKPEMIVLHFTGSEGLKGNLNYFKNDTLESGRTEIAGGGNLNVGVHFVVDKNGEIYSLLPEEIMGRHAIGFNYTAFGIENVGRDANSLTEAQIVANIELVNYLKGKYPSILYLIGHHEYQNRSLAHYSLYKEADRSYKPTLKIDPGKNFMKKVREGLKKEYDLEFLK